MKSFYYEYSIRGNITEEEVNENFKWEIAEAAKGGDDPYPWSATRIAKEFENWTHERSTVLPMDDVIKMNWPDEQYYFDITDVEEE